MDLSLDVSHTHLDIVSIMLMDHIPNALVKVQHQSAHSSAEQVNLMLWWIMKKYCSKEFSYIALLLFDSRGLKGAGGIYIWPIMEIGGVVVHILAFHAVGQGFDSHIRQS